MDTSLINAIISVAALAAIGFCGIVFWTYVISDWIKCSKCNIRIASIRIPNFLFLNARRIEELGDDVEFLNSSVCSKCWEEDLKGLPFPSIKGWWPGATVEYFKNTPSLLAFVLSIASLMLGVMNFLR